MNAVRITRRMSGLLQDANDRPSVHSGAHRLGDVPVPSASTRKISILMAALAAVHAGTLTLEQPVTIEARYQDNDSGTFQHLTPGPLQRYCESVGLKATIHRFGIAEARARPRARAGDHDHTGRPEPAARADLPGDHRRDGRRPARLHLGTVPPRDGHPLVAKSLLPAVTKIAHKTGTGSRGFMDAGIVFKEDRPLFTLAAYTEHVPAALPDGTPGFAAANLVIGRMARACWDALG
jgi:beta-lactamase class A